MHSKSKTASDDVQNSDKEVSDSEEKKDVEHEGINATQGSETAAAEPLAQPEHFELLGNSNFHTPEVEDLQKDIQELKQEIEFKSQAFVF